MSLEINLLHQHRASTFVRKAVMTLRVTTIIAGIIVLSCLALLFVLKRTTQTSIVRQTEVLDSIMARIAQNQEKETGVLLLNQKYKEINATLTSEPPFLSRYETILRELPQSSESGQIKGFNISRSGKSNIQLAFEDIISLTAFLSKLESEAFRKNFTSVKTSGISFSDNNTKNLIFSIDVQF